MFVDWKWEEATNKLRNLGFRVYEGLSKFYELKFVSNHPTTTIKVNNCNPQPHNMYLHRKFLATIWAPKVDICGLLVWKSVIFITLPNFQEPKLGTSFSPNQSTNAKHPWHEGCLSRLKAKMRFNHVIEKVSSLPQHSRVIDFMFRWSSINGRILGKVLPTSAWKEAYNKREDYPWGHQLTWP